MTKKFFTYQSFLWEWTYVIIIIKYASKKFRHLFFTLVLKRGFAVSMIAGVSRKYDVLSQFGWRAAANDLPLELSICCCSKFASNRCDPQPYNKFVELFTINLSHLWESEYLIVQVLERSEVISYFLFNCLIIVRVLWLKSRVNFIHGRTGNIEKNCLFLRLICDARCEEVGVQLLAPRWPSCASRVSVLIIEVERRWRA